MNRWVWWSATEPPGSGHGDKLPGDGSRRGEGAWVVLAGSAGFWGLVWWLVARFT